MSQDPLRDAFKELRDPEGGVRARNFPVKSRNFIQRKKDEMKRKDRSAARKLIRPENADAIVDVFPAPGDQVHGITSGDFVMALQTTRTRAGTPSTSTRADTAQPARSVARPSRKPPGAGLKTPFIHSLTNTKTRSEKTTGAKKSVHLTTSFSTRSSAARAISSPLTATCKMELSPEWIMGVLLGLGGVIATLAGIIYNSLSKRLEAQSVIIQGMRVDIERLSKGCQLETCLWKAR